MKKISVIFIVTVISCSLTAQTASIDSLDICAAQEVILPVNGTNILNVGAITLYIGYDTVNLVYDTIENVDTQIQGLTVNLMNNPMQLAFAWSNTTPVNFINNKLFDIKFVSNGNNAIVHFNSNCEISDSNGIVIATNYLNGAVINAEPYIISNPSDTAVNEGTNAAFTVSAINTKQYAWRESQDNGSTWITLDDNEFYSGTNTNQLTIFNTPLSFNNNLYQCQLSSGACQLTSMDAKLTVDEIIKISDLKRKELPWALINPNPVSDQIKIAINCPVLCEMKFTLFNSKGQITKDFSFLHLNAGIQHIILPADDLNAGVYYLQINSVDNISKFNLSLVVVKIK